MLSSAKDAIATEKTRFANIAGLLKEVEGDSDRV
jgi:hypothetical protein